ncbi:alpha-L-fucosidase [Schaalia sp. ZJ1691]|uniref:alpha-L-fucosidase n=1 Tax=Schaalia sp. ZJ1691 TaxID=2709404 RepID=UPI0013EBEE66|nr:alpha-L-fucosidase [Schaalia sp. ZJ1691]
MTDVPSWEELDARPCPPWFPKAKFGIFIHWGVFSVPAWRTLSNEQFGSYAEWYYASVYGPYRNADGDFHERHYGDALYRDFASQFTAELFDPDQWAELFKRAGARYVVLTSKHHEGYCLWPTKNPHKKNWNAGDVGPHRDLVGDLTEAVRRAGLKMGLYYSMIDWETNRSHRCDGGFFIPQKDADMFGIPEERYPTEILEEQWKDFNTRYAPSLIYTDGGEWDLSEEYAQTRQLLGWLYNEAPNRDDVVVNDRMHVGMPGNHGDYYSTEYQDIEGFGTNHPWEESRGIGGSYGFNRAENIEDYATAPELIHLLVRTVSQGGNFLLNVGPTADGRIDVLQQERLLQIGAWLDEYGEAIYETSPANGWVASENVYLTSKDHRVFAIVEGGQQRVQLSLPAGIRPVSAVNLASGESVSFSLINEDEARCAQESSPNNTECLTSELGIEFTSPKCRHDEYPTVVAITIGH